LLELSFDDEDDGIDYQNDPDLPWPFPQNLWEVA
jgi:hypothetical protein